MRQGDGRVASSLLCYRKAYHLARLFVADPSLRGQATSPNWFAASMPNPQEIIDYYAFSKWDYRIYNARFSNLSMHYGLWDETTHTHRQALLNENRVVAAVAGVTRSDFVVDLGCGYGSTAVWLATHIGCRVLGITLSDDQVAAARKLALKHSVDHFVAFATMDYHATKLSDATFDVAIAIESLAHSPHKKRALKEAWRILKPGGRLAVADGFFAKRKDSLTPLENQIARTCFEGVHVPPLPERLEFADWLKSSGFRRIRWCDKTSQILPTAQRVHHLGKFLLPVSKVAAHLGIRGFQTSHMRAFINQFYAFRDGLGVYGIFSAIKPRPVVTPGLHATRPSPSPIQQSARD